MVHDLFFLLLISFDLFAVLVDNFRLDLLAILISCGLCGFLLIFGLGIDPVDVESLRGGQVLAVQILEQDVVGHPCAELVVLEAAVLDEGADVIPVLVVVLFIGLAHAGELIRNLLCDVIADLLREAVVLERAS